MANTGVTGAHSYASRPAGPYSRSIHHGPSTVPRDTQGGSPSRCPIGVRRGECELGDWRKPRAYLQLGGRASLGVIVHVHYNDHDTGGV